MKRIVLLSLFLLLSLIVLVLLCGCFVFDQDQEDEGFQRFFVAETVFLDSNRNVRVLVDRETKVMYCYVEGFRSGGLCVLVDDNGLPMLYDGPFDET